MKITSAEFKRGIRGTNPIAYDGIPQVTFIGRSNVGKSSLINALTGSKNLVKVSDKPGKTREINFFLINHKHYLVDLPGYGYARVDAEEKEKLKKLIIWYFTASGIHPRWVVLVIDTKVGVTPFDEQMIQILQEQGHPYIVAANKTDKLSKTELAKQISLITVAAHGGEVVACSAITRGGSQDLLRKIF
jgi:GTP-binding protein